MSLKKLGLVAVLGVFGCGLVTGQIDVGSIGDDTTTAPAAKQVAASPVAGIPADYLVLYRKADGTCKNVDWALLAAIGLIESNHGQSKLPGVRSGSNSAGAQGPMQFMPGTWKGMRSRHPDVGRNVYDPANAIPGAANLLCDNGAARDLRRAVWLYNHSNAYVNKVLGQADRYRKH